MIELKKLDRHVDEACPCNIFIIRDCLNTNCYASVCSMLCNDPYRHTLTLVRSLWNIGRMHLPPCLPFCANTSSLNGAVVAVYAAVIEKSGRCIDRMRRQCKPARHKAAFDRLPALLLLVSLLYFSPSHHTTTHTSNIMGLASKVSVQ